MRFIFISAGIGGPWPNYSVGSPGYNWLKARIDEAHSAGLWVAVALHKECLSDGTVHTSCESTFDPFNLALTDGVDIWLNGHEHNYERSYQLSSCTGSGTTISSCQPNTGTFVRGSGMVVNIIGTGGKENYAICSASCQPKQDYFQKLCGSNNDIGIPQTSGCNNDYGFVKFTVTTSSISAQWVDACVASPCGFSDSYIIQQNPNQGDFGVSSSIARVARGTIGAGRTYSSVAVVSVNSFGSFSGTVSLVPGSVSGGPSCPGPNCPTVSLSTMSLSVAAGGTNSTTLTVTSTPSTSCSNPDN